MKKGKLIVIEGTDASGKETQTNLLIERLKHEKIPCATMSFPRYNTPTGRIIGQCYLGKEDLGEGDIAWFGEADSVASEIASLYYAADRKVAVPEIEKILNQGKNLILDRWVESNMGHQAGKETDLKKRIETINFIHDLEYKLLKLPKPEGIIFLYMPYKIGRKLKQGTLEKPDGHESNIKHLKRAEETYLQLAEIYKWAKIDCAPDKTLDSLKTPEKIHEEVYEHVKNILCL